jgi:hypothetical protein
MEDQMMEHKMMDANDKMMSGGGAAMSKGYKKMKSKLYGYKEFTLDGKNYRVYGSMNGMTPREYVESWGKPLTNAYFRKRSTSSSKKSSPKRQPKWSLPENPTRRQPRRKSKTAAMRGMTKGGKRKNNKTKKQRKH